MTVQAQTLHNYFDLASLTRQQIAKCLRLQMESRKSNSNFTASLAFPDREKSLQSSAVLVPLIWRDQEWHLLFIRRSESVSRHKGQIAFPGGRWEEEDDSFLETAKRETREELGEMINPVEILGALPSVSTKSTGFIIYPFVGVLEEPLQLQPDSWEVAEVLSLPLQEFLQPSIASPVEFDSGNINVWGATARITHQFINCITGGEWL